MLDLFQVSKSATGLSNAVNSSNSANPFDTAVSNPTLSEGSRQAIKGTRWEAMDNEIDENLGGLLSSTTCAYQANSGAMSAQLGRLKVLGAALGDEVEDQNRMLDRIQVKADRNDAIVRSQDHQMKKLLGYKVGSGQLLVCACPTVLARWETGGHCRLGDEKEVNAVLGGVSYLDCDN